MRRSTSPESARHPSRHGGPRPTRLQPASPAAGHVAGDSSWRAGDSGDWQYGGAREGQSSADGPRRARGGSRHSRRISGPRTRVSDGGFGVGSAALIAGGAQPLGRTVQAYRDTMTYRTQDAPGCGPAGSDVVVLRRGSARRAGFSPAQHG